MSRLMDLRLAHGYETQRELAEATGLTVDTISRLERGAHLTPNTKTLGRLARAFGMQPSALAEELADDRKAAA